ncbi:uncharacterized protein BDR25DRAFT_360476 [Lindgomyces ingoldianus]|uniref:Uncharacterized protein n=1 Tax=Lindgomyces ingoldianus TaxID=673940 RepID=A0ACB6QF39_9PLEO|nr:uncharacterized protein BDR25DRAFT_360476 [Lindgomyces ingoldianus]KAF2465534.1 hypothetical protein BDR25DRAFT_360476 [Lindgomyces ingoldianus]
MDLVVKLSCEQNGVDGILFGRLHSRSKGLHFQKSAPPHLSKLSGMHAQPVKRLHKSDIELEYSPVELHDDTDVVQRCQSSLAMRSWQPSARGAGEDFELVSRRGLASLNLGCCCSNPTTFDAKTANLRLQSLGANTSQASPAASQLVVELAALAFSPLTQRRLSLVPTSSRVFLDLAKPSPRHHAHAIRVWSAVHHLNSSAPPARLWRQVKVNIVRRGAVVLPPNTVNTAANMVKPDPARNYYADLEISANADENEIRKAFRQLALKFHPDRNPGREAEFVTKFQQIQAAHEVLSDPQLRLKYDNERRKYRNLHIPSYNPNSPRTRPPPPPRNAYTTTTSSGSYYRPPPPNPSKPPPQHPPPPQHHTTFSSGAERFTSSNFRAPPTAQRPSQRQTDAQARAHVFTAWQKMKQPRGEEERPANNPNNPNGAPFGRTQSTRTPSRKGFDPAAATGDEKQARSSYRSHYERPVPSPPQSGDPLKHFKEQMEGDVPFAEANRVRTPYSSTKGERTSMFGEGIGRSASVRNSPMGRPATSESGGFYSDSGRRPQRKSYGGNATEPFVNMYPSSTSDDESNSDEIPKASFQANRNKATPPKMPLNQQQTQNQGSPRGPFQPPPVNGHSNNTTEATPNPFKSRSEESINMKFSPSDWHGKFQGAPDYFAPNMAKGTFGKGRTSPTRGRSSHRTASEKVPTSGQSQPPPPPTPFTEDLRGMPPPPPPPIPMNNNVPSGSASAPHPAKFAPEQWANTFKESGWAYPAPKKDTSPRRGSVTAAKRKPPSRKASTAPNGTPIIDLPGGSASSNTSSGTPRSKSARSSKQASVEEENGDAMDIDSSTPPVEKPKPLAPEGGRGRAATEPSAPPKARAASESGTTSPTFDGLAGIANVEPFLPSTKVNGEALDGLGDLKSTLPFESRASSIPATKANKATRLQTPRVPEAPHPPDTLDASALTTYLNKMEKYVKAFNKYNQVMIEHFVARQVEARQLPEHFINRRGEPSNKPGLESCTRWAKQDAEVLQTWSNSQVMHSLALEKCKEVRAKALDRFVKE